MTVRTSFFTPARPNGPSSRAGRVLLGGALAALLSLAGCGGGGNDEDVVDRGPTTISVAAKLNGLYWDPSESRLYLTDDDSNSLKVWDGKTFSTAAAMPPAPPSGATLGGVARTADGTFYVTRFGFGTDGTVVALPKSGAAYNLTGLDSARRRVGLASAPDGALIDTWFVRGGTGSLSELSVSNGKGVEKDLISGLGKPVGVAVAGDQLFVSDQNTAQVLVFSLNAVRAKPAALADGRLLATFTTLDGLDLMAAAKDGTLYVGGSAGKLYRISPTGNVTTLVSGWPKIRGVALDAANRRLLVAVTSPDVATQPASIRIVPID